MIADCSNMYQILHNLNVWVIRTFEILIIRICMDVESRFKKDCDIISLRWIHLNISVLLCLCLTVSFVTFSYCLLIVEERRH